MYIDNNKVGKQIALLRTSKGITQNELGERIGVSFQAVSKWERGDTDYSPNSDGDTNYDSSNGNDDDNDDDDDDQNDDDDDQGDD